MPGVNEQSYSAGRFVMDIGGENAGFLKKFSGCNMEADIAINDLGPDNVQKKHVSKIKWSPGKATVGIGMGNELYQWIKASFDKGYLQKDGAVTAANFDYKAQSVMEFKRALITSLTVPKLDGGSKDAAYFDVEFDAEEVRWAKGGGEDIRGKIGPKQKAWLCSNFHLVMGDLPTNGVVSSIDSFTWKCSVVADEVGTLREYSKHPAKVTVPNLKFSISKKAYPAWADAAKKWFVDGEHEEANELSGSILFLNPRMEQGSPIGEITLLNCGFVKFINQDLEANSEKIARFDVEMYVEKMEFKLNYVDAAK